MKSTNLGYKTIHDKISAIQRNTKLTQEQRDIAIRKLRSQQKTPNTKTKLNRKLLTEDE